MQFVNEIHARSFTLLIVVYYYYYLLGQKTAQYTFKYIIRNLISGFCFANDQHI